MNQIPTIKARLAAFEEEVRAIRSGGEPSFADRLALESLHAVRDELQAELSEALSRRWVEVVELRLSGEPADDGRLPLNVVSDLTTTLHRSFYTTAAYQENGREIKHVRSDARIVEALDFQLAGMRQGSTRLFFTAKSQPDLFGNSLAHETLHATFGLLSASTDDSLLDAVGRVGTEGARRTGAFVSELKKHGLEASFRWLDEGGQEVVWEGTRRRITSLEKGLASLKQQEQDTVEISAVLDGMNQRGRIELKKLDARGKPEGRLYNVTYSLNMLPEVRRLHLGERVVAMLRRTQMFSVAAQRKRTTYLLTDIEPGSRA